MPSTSSQALLSFFGFKGNLSSQSAAFLCMTAICILVPLELSQLIFALIGAAVYAVLQALVPKPTKTNCQLAADREQNDLHRSMRNSTQWQSPAKGGSGAQIRPRPRGPPSALHATPAPTVVKPEVYQPSSNPVFAPKFESTGFEAEVNELVCKLEPGADEDHAVQRLVFHVKRVIEPIFPDAEVTGFVHSSIKCGKAFGVAVPEVDIVANISPHVLGARQRGAKDLQRVLKCAVRSACDRLVSGGGLKFRRSAFRVEEPRVTVLVPQSLGFFEEAIPVDFSINAVTPFYTKAFLTECGGIEPRAKSLILLVKRWSKDRGICHASKGHFSPYIWTLLVMYFLQVGLEEEGPLLPLLNAFKIAACNAEAKGKPTSPPLTKRTPEQLSVAELFCRFARFYSKSFVWRREAVSIRLGRRAPPGVRLPLHVILRDDGTTDIGPSIEDPFKAGSNLGTCMNEVTVTRLYEELARADDMCSTGGSLTTLLEPWAPPDADAKAEDKSGGSGPGEQAENADKSGGSGPGEQAGDSPVLCPAANAPWRQQKAQDKAA